MLTLWAARATRNPVAPVFSGGSAALEPVAYPCPAGRSPAAHGAPPIHRIPAENQRRKIFPDSGRHLRHREDTRRQNGEKIRRGHRLPKSGQHHFLAVRELKIYGDLYRRRTDNSI